MYTSITYDPELAMTYFMPRSNLVTKAFVWEKVKIIYFAETNGALGLKVGRCIQLNDYLKLHKYQRLRFSLTLAKGHSDFKIKSCFSQKKNKQKKCWVSGNQISCESLWEHRNQN